MAGIDDVPPWVLFGVPVAIVLLALMRQSSGGGSAYGAVTAYQPTPADPGLISLAQSEVAARSQAFGGLVNIFGQEEISRIAASRDTALETIQAGVANNRTEAAREASLAQTDAARLVGIAQSDNQTALGIEQAKQSAHMVDSQGATAKYIAKKQNNPWNHLIDQAGSIIKGIGSLFGK